MGDILVGTHDDHAASGPIDSPHVEDVVATLEIRAEHLEGRTIRAHFRAPRSRGPAPAVLIMCGADMFKEDRGWAGEYALDNGLASLVMDAPGTGENPFPWEPGSVTAWEAAIDYLAARPEVNAGEIGAFGISRGGYSVMQLAGTCPEKIGAVVAIAGHPFGYRLSTEEMTAVVEARNRRAAFVFGAPGGPPSFETWSAERENEIFSRWALSELGILDRITQPLLMINGKHDHLAPIGNIYFMLEHGPPSSTIANGRRPRLPGSGRSWASPPADRQRVVRHAKPGKKSTLMCDRWTPSPVRVWRTACTMGCGPET